MNTEQNTTTPEEKNLPSQQAADSSSSDVSAQSGNTKQAEPTVDAQSADDDAGNVGNQGPVKARGKEAWDEEPGDDIGNRLPGAGGRRAGQQAAQAPRPPKAEPPSEPADAGEEEEAQGQAAAGPGGGGTGAKRRRRRRKGGGAGAHPPAGAPGAGETAAAASGEEGAEAESSEEASAGEDAGAPEGEAAQQGGEKRRRGHKGQTQAAAALRERPAFSVGEEVFGKVHKVASDAIWIDIAGKAMGLFDRRELLDEDPPQEGDQFIATVASTGVRGGMLVLSRAATQLEEARAKLEAASKSGETVAGFVTGAVKGGLEVDISGLRAFAPASHVDLRHGADLSYLVGQRLDFHVTHFAKKGRDIVVSRKKMLEEDVHKQRQEAMSKLEPGSVHKGIVRKVVAWGVFVALPDADGVEGLVHLTEVSHDRNAKLGDLFKPGAEIDVKVVRVDEKGKLWLSRKAVTTDPWDAVREKYAVGTRHKGRIARLQPFGAFVELEPGIDGLCHTADLSLKPIQHPSEAVKVDDEIEVVVASCDGASRKISLHPAPPAGEENEPRQRIQQGKTVKAAVVQVTDGGLIVRVLGVTGRAARGFIPAGHTGTQRGTDLRKEFPVNTRVEAKILEVDPRRNEAKLSIRALKDDAEKLAYQQYRAGVAREAKFGTFADLMKKNNN